METRRRLEDLRGDCMRKAVIATVRIGVVATLFSVFGCGRNEVLPGRSVDFSVCVSALTNLSTFAETPLGASYLASSYDRTGGNEDWDTMPTPGKDGLYPIAVLKGPGCVKRIWHTNISAERWHFFFDGESVARMVATRDELFGDRAPFEPPLAACVSSGYYCYTPIPFQKSLRIAVSFPKDISGIKSFYQVNYETYDSSVRVVSFPKQLRADETALVNRTRNVWNDAETDAKSALAACGQKRSETVPPGGSVAWLQQEGAGVLRAFWVRWNDATEPSALVRAKRLRELTLRMYWDGAAEPSVDVPLGDFFCNGLHRRRFASLPLAVLDDAMVCRFPMPFRKSVRAELRNDGSTPVTVELGYDIQPLEPPTSNDVNYFHARWNSSTASGRPYNLLRAEGRGHYVGCYLISMGADGSWNNLEGDDMMYLNGEAISSLHGTGLEDYFNGAWYYNGLFDRPLHGLLEKAAMRTAQYRFHLSDPVSFQNGFLMNWEFGHGNASQGYMSSIAYWYQPEPHAAGTRMPPVGERYPFPDRVEPAAMVASLFELEHVGLYREAAERSALFAEKYAAQTFTPLLRLRAAANRELADGFDAVRDTYAAMAVETPGSEASRQAKALLWYHESPSNALLAAHANMRVKFYLDGQAAGEGADPSALTPFVAPVVIGPGAHEIEAEVTPICPSPWVSFRLRTQTTNVASDGTWECARTRPANWPRTDDPAVTWTNVLYAKAGLPKMNWWQFMPNGYANMQGGDCLIEPAWDGWEKQPYVTTYLRKRFVVPAR